ncbi:Na+/H+ antiporter subunit E [Rubrobacter indicoceani]|uniref:Na+/H+ antiporter subunit E n=1 Tax=Rubrobacter indicoceani TaxID=2051957 RepID=UPI000E5C19C6|nr:Na+/H+ antiporter subunit E [Rubrobacter indicoceani]
MVRFAVSLVLLTGVYCSVISSFAGWDILMGAVFSGTILFVFRDFLFGGKPKPMPDLFSRVLYLPLFVAGAVWDIVKGTVEVIFVVLHIRPLDKPGIVAVPIGERSRVGLAVSAIQTTLSPGTYLVEVDYGRGVWLIHALDASDPDAVRRDRERFYQRYQRKVFP